MLQLKVNNTDTCLKQKYQQHRFGRGKSRNRKAAANHGTGPATASAAGPRPTEHILGAGIVVSVVFAVVC